MPVWLIIILSIVIALLLIALIPFRYELELSVSEYFRLRLRIFLGKLPVLSLLPYDGEKEEAAKAEQGKSHIKAKKEKMRHNDDEPRSHPLQVIRLLINPVLWDQIFDLLHSLYQVLRVRQYRLSGHIGFESPMQTARLTAILALLDHPRWDCRELEPIWTEDCIDLHLNMYGNFTAIALAWRILRFMRNREARALYRQLRAMV